MAKFDGQGSLDNEVIVIVNEVIIITVLLIVHSFFKSRPTHTYHNKLLPSHNVLVKDICTYPVFKFVHAYY